MTTPKLKSTRTRHLADMCRRVSARPILKPESITPSDPRLEVIGVFNPAVWISSNQVRLIVRVDERPRDHVRRRLARPSSIPVARIDFSQGRPRLDIVDVVVNADYARDNQGVLPNNSRSAKRPANLLLSHLSHLRVAEYNGTWKANANPLVRPCDEWTEFGCEDPRVTHLGHKTYLTYSAISRFGAIARLAQIGSNGRIVSPRIMLGPDHKHAFLLPDQIRGRFWVFVRPLVRSWIAEDGIWSYRSTDLKCWTEPIPILMPRLGHWDSQRIGPGTVLRIPEGWLLLYYGVDLSDTYHVGAALLDYSDPATVLARTDKPLLSPTLAWERTGRRADTVFCSGATLDSSRSMLRLFYGAADTCVGAGEISIADLRATLCPVEKQECHQRHRMYQRRNRNGK
jgi:predicted GH43/DUF377 family glycosyl hydrolase